jgi:hypothetical protein
LASYEFEGYALAMDKVAPTRAEVIRRLGTVSCEERLGLLVKTGFSMVVAKNLALNFKALLERAAKPVCDFGVRRI